MCTTRFTLTFAAMLDVWSSNVRNSESQSYDNKVLTFTTVFATMFASMFTSSVRNNVRNHVHNH
eukprot:7627334-Lingulodinium_polyedra.AAC.1